MIKGCAPPLDSICIAASNLKPYVFLHIKRVFRKSAEGKKGILPLLTGRRDGAGEYIGIRKQTFMERSGIKPLSALKPNLFHVFGGGRNSRAANVKC